MGHSIKERNNKLRTIFDHRLNYSRRCTPDNLKIIDTVSDDYSLNIKESLYIKQLQPILTITIVLLKIVVPYIMVYFYSTLIVTQESLISLHCHREKTVIDFDVTF